MSPTINALWIGSKLGPLHAACIRSFVRNGHKTVLHVYEEIQDLPEGVELFDANQLMRRSEIVKHRRTGSLALASDIYRYRILREELGIYVDCDVFCIKPFPDEEFILGWEDDSYVATAVLRIPKESELLTAMRSATDDPNFIPPWRNKSKRMVMSIRKALHFPQTVANQQWGVIGPKAITYYINSMGLRGVVGSEDLYCPLAFGHRNLLYSPGLSLFDLATPRSFGVHLWSSKLDGINAPEGSPLEQIINMK